MDIAFFDTMHTGQLTSRMTNDASVLAGCVGQKLKSVAFQLILLSYIIQIIVFLKDLSRVPVGWGLEF